MSKSQQNRKVARPETRCENNVIDDNSILRVKSLRRQIKDRDVWSKLLKKGRIYIGLKMMYLEIECAARPRIFSQVGYNFYS